MNISYELLRTKLPRGRVRIQGHSNLLELLPLETEFLTVGARTRPSPTSMYPAYEDLLAQLVAGDENAFTLLYRRRQASIFLFALHMSGRPDIAEDVTQETFLVLLRSGQRFDASRGSLSSYLYGVARNQVLKRLDPVISPEDCQEQESSMDTFDDLSQAQVVDQVRRAVLSLPTQYREVVVLCDLHASSYEDAAMVLECPVGTVRSRLSRARALLAQKLSGIAAMRQIMMSHEELDQALKVLVEQDRELSAPSRVETNLLRSFRAQHRHGARRATPWLAAVATATLVVAEVSWYPAEMATISFAPAAPAAPALCGPGCEPVRNRPVLQRPVVSHPREVVTEFFPVPNTAAPFETGVFFRVRVPASTMRTVGLPVREDRWLDEIDADVLVGQEGIVRAIRFVNFER